MAFIVEYIIQRRFSPSMDEIRAHLGVSKQRVGTLLAQLVKDGSIERPMGTQRAIVVPGLMVEIAKRELRAVGWVVDEDMKRARFAAPLPQDNLALVAIIEHVPDDAPSRHEA
ncbi:SOS-response transcriptional repressor LexA [Sphingomonas jejuensis]|uniref:SOS-response transcriptional repressor LexA n=1 Tax=Sphingomonas jejuensis TaxID=904715 RepID=A0ABX0XKW9_9SPHN|nr:SOS-response transcriptional repressor LexA [Sphingomonas jejuensis]